MNRLEINPNNEKYYSKEFMQGYKCGTKSQFDADAKVLDKIRSEIESMDFDFGDYYDNTNEIIEMVCKVIDKYKAESEVNEC